MIDMLDVDRVILGDCISGMQNIPDECVDLVVSDPPYGILYKSCYRKDKSHRFCKEIVGDNDIGLIERYAKECYRILKPNSAMYMFCSWKKIDYFIPILRSAKFNLKNVIVWDKKHHTAGDLQAQFGQSHEFLILANKGRRTFNGNRITDIWQIPHVPHQMAVHQNQKPVELIKLCIEKHSNPGDLIFDGFMGSGTTAIAAMASGRHFIGYEIDNEYFEICANRIRDYKNEVENEACKP